MWSTRNFYKNNIMEMLDFIFIRNFCSTLQGAIGDHNSEFMLVFSDVL